MWQNSLKSSILPLLTDLYLLLHSLKQIRANHYIEPWLLFSAEQRRGLWGSRTNDLSGEKFRSRCSLRSVGMRHCLREEKAEEFFLPSPALPFLNQTGQSMEKLSGMGWPHGEKGRRRDKMAPGLPSSSVSYGSRQFPPRMLTQSKEQKAIGTHLLLAEGFWPFYHSKQLASKATPWGI